MTTRVRSTFPNRRDSDGYLTEACLGNFVGQKATMLSRGGDHESAVARLEVLRVEVGREEATIVWEVPDQFTVAMDGPVGIGYQVVERTGTVVGKARIMTAWPAPEPALDASRVVDGEVVSSRAAAPKCVVCEAELNVGQKECHRCRKVQPEPGPDLTTSVGPVGESVTSAPAVAAPRQAHVESLQSADRPEAVPVTPVYASESAPSVLVDHEVPIRDDDAILAVLRFMSDGTVQWREP
jgi:hypothetical protein